MQEHIVPKCTGIPIGYLRYTFGKYLSFKNGILSLNIAAVALDIHWLTCYLFRSQAYIYIYIYIYTKTFLNQPAMGPTLNSPFGEVVSLGI